MTALSRIVLAMAGLFGASGVALAAAAAHIAGASDLSTAAEFLIVHAAAAIALVGVATQAGRPSRPAAYSAAALLAGAGLFSGDLALRRLAGMKLLWGTAPVGGTLMIVGWVMIAITALTLRLPRR